MGEPSKRRNVPVSGELRRALTAYEAPKQFTISPNIVLSGGAVLLSLLAISFTILH